MSSYSLQPAFLQSFQALLLGSQSTCSFLSSTSSSAYLSSHPSIINTKQSKTRSSPSFLLTMAVPSSDDATMIKKKRGRASKRLESDTDENDDDLIMNGLDTDEDTVDIDALVSGKSKIPSKYASAPPTRERRYESPSAISAASRAAAKIQHQPDKDDNNDDTDEDDNEHQDGLGLSYDQLDDEQDFDNHHNNQDQVVGLGASAALGGPAKKEEKILNQGPPVADFAFHPLTKEALAKKNITNLTEVQAGTFDMFMNGSDIIARSRTGTGKTLAFGIPIVERLVQMAEKGEIDIRERARGPFALILAPTRELASQVATEIEDIARPHRLSVKCFYGGSSYNPQESALRNGIDILVGTPGRIIDHIEKGSLFLGKVKFAVLDEADRMLDMGFSQDVELIYETMPEKKDRQTVLFSATVPSWVQQMASKHQNNPKTFDSVGKYDNQTATTVEHYALRVPRGTEIRNAMLEDVLTVYGGGVKGSRTMVFTQTKKECDELGGSGMLHCGAGVLHGDISQASREVILSKFRRGIFPVLVATDVAARGLDISGVDLVIQYNLPQDPESYVHRAGRTGRAGRSGKAVIMYSDNESQGLRNLEKICKIKFARVGPPSVETVLLNAAKAAASSLDEVEPKVINYFQPHAEALLQSVDPTKALAAALALVAGKTKIQEKSLLTGDPDFKTLLYTSKRYSIQPRDVIITMSRLCRDLGINERVGKILVCEDTKTAVFDFSQGKLDELLAVDFNSPDYDFTVTIPESIPKLRSEESFREPVRNNFRQTSNFRRVGPGGVAGYRGERRTHSDRRYGEKGGYQRQRGRPEPRSGRSFYGGGGGSMGGGGRSSKDFDDDWF